MKKILPLLLLIFVSKYLVAQTKVPDYVKEFLKKYPTKDKPGTYGYPTNSILKK